MCDLTCVFGLFVIFLCNDLNKHVSFVCDLKCKLIFLCV